MIPPARTLWPLFVTFALYVAGAGRLRAQPTPGEVAGYPHEAAVGVYRSVLDLLFRSAERPGVVVIADSLTPSIVSLDEVRRVPTRLEPATIEHFARVNSVPYGPYDPTQFAVGPFPALGAYPIPVLKIGQVERDAVEQRGRPLFDNAVAELRPGEMLDDMPFWAGFRNRYPEAWGMTVFSRVGFNPARTQALVSVMHRCGPSCTSTESVFLTNTGSPARWRVAARIPHWRESRESLGLGSLRFTGRHASMLAAARRDAAVQRRRAADSLRMETMPRRITGMVVHRATKRPVTGYPVFFWPLDQPRKRATVTDERGRFVISNPRVAGSVMDVQCRAESGTEEVIAGTGLYVRPGLDTVVTLEVASIALCWRRRAGHVQSGEVESGLFSRSQYPDARESAVYDAVLAPFVAGKAPDERPLLNAHTIPPCPPRKYVCEGLPQLALLQKENVLDSTIVREFEEKTRERIPMGSGFASARGLTLLTPAIESYLTVEGMAPKPGRESRGGPDPLLYGIREAYPRADGILSFSRIAFNASGDRALVLVRHEGHNADTMRVTLLRSHQGTWVTERWDLKLEAVTSVFSGSQCMLARGGSQLTDDALRKLNRSYHFTFVTKDVNAKAEVLDLSRKLLWRPEDSQWDIALGGYLITVRDSTDAGLFGLWRHIGRDAYPTDGHGNRTAERNGHFCAKPIGE